MPEQRRDIGGNINGQGISANLVTSWTFQSNARTHLVINESKLAALIQGHTERVIYRMKGSAGIVDDDHAHEKHNPIEFARTLNILAPVGCLVYGGNEPGSTTLFKLNEWTLRFVEECVRLGRKPVVFNNFVFHPSQGAAGWRVLKPAAQAAIQADGSIGIHIYFNRTIAVSRDAFRVIGDVHEVLGDVPIDVTEYGCAPDYDPFRGWQTAYGEDAYVHELIAGVEQYGGAKIDWQVYIYGLWAQGRSYEITHAETVKRRITEFNKQMTQTPNYGNRIERGLISLVGASVVNVRPTPSIAQTAIGQVKGGELLPYWDKPQNGWWQIEYAGRIAYVSDTFVDITAAPIDPHPPVPLPDLEFDLNGRITKVELVSWLRAVADVIEHGVLETA